MGQGRDGSPVTGLVVRLIIGTLALLLVGCSSPRTPAATERPAASTAPTTPPAWTLDVTDSHYDTDVTLGDTIELSFTVTNTGTSANPNTEIQFGGASDNADLVGCIPKCEVTESFGDSFAVMSGVPAGGEMTYQAQFQTKALGVISWSICFYDKDPVGEQFDCLEGTTRIGS